MWSVCVRTSWFSGFEQHSDQFWDVEVSGVVQGVHVGPAAPQTHVGAQRDQLAGETQRGRRVACTHSEDRTHHLMLDFIPFLGRIVFDLINLCS